jgi:hypothetical protein
MPFSSCFIAYAFPLQSATRLKKDANANAKANANANTNAKSDHRLGVNSTQRGVYAFLNNVTSTRNEEKSGVPDRRESRMRNRSQSAVPKVKDMRIANWDAENRSLMLSGRRTCDRRRIERRTMA